MTIYKFSGSEAKENVFLSIFFLLSIKRGKKYTLVMYFINFAFVFTFFLLQRKKIYALKLGYF